MLITSRFSLIAAAAVALAGWLTACSDRKPAAETDEPSTEAVAAQETAVEAGGAEVRGPLTPSKPAQVDEREHELYRRLSATMDRVAQAEAAARTNDQALAAAFEQMESARERYRGLLAEREDVRALNAEVADLQAAIQAFLESKTGHAPVQE